MYLHNDKEIFESIINEVNLATGFELEIIEKDYYIMLFLKKLSEKVPALIFKGGTSLSKCFKIIDRFSEDIDLNLDQSYVLGQARKKNFKKDIAETINELGLTFTNSEQTRSRRDYNKYIVDYDTIYSNTTLKQHLIIETVYTIEAFPTEKKMASSIMYDFLREQGYSDIIEKYELSPFAVTVQTLERTFADKIFAICDYYLDGRITEHSRHLYDLYKLKTHVRLDDEFMRLFNAVKEIRSKFLHCPSAWNEKCIFELLGEIIGKQTYKKDYENNTLPLLLKKVSYEDAIKTLEAIMVFLFQFEVQQPKKQKF